MLGLTITNCLCILCSAKGKWVLRTFLLNSWMHVLGCFSCHTCFGSIQFSAVTAGFTVNKWSFHRQGLTITLRRNVAISQIWQTVLIESNSHMSHVSFTIWYLTWGPLCMDSICVVFMIWSLIFWFFTADMWLAVTASYLGADLFNINKT